MKGKLRQSDVNECWAISNLTADKSLEASYFYSIYCWTLLKEKEPIAIFGIGSISHFSTLAYPWLLATDEIEKAGIYLARHIRKLFKMYLPNYDFVINWVDARNKLAIKFALWLGFHIDPPQPFGKEGKLFHKIWMKGQRNV